MKQLQNLRNCMYYRLTHTASTYPVCGVGRPTPRGRMAHVIKYAIMSYKQFCHRKYRKCYVWTISQLLCYTELQYAASHIHYSTNCNIRPVVVLPNVYKQSNF